ncbi:hypothetical protein [Spirillospora sp. NPDC029432]|uniref:hypothetical protein n=1 Tax=Spirillospora sp. NPDC029432 TaxID=3154599 RepID=UPI0034565085
MYCSTCGDERDFERPPCQDGHGPDCPELACVDCGSAVLTGFPAGTPGPASGTASDAATAAAEGSEAPAPDPAPGPPRPRRTASQRAVA